MESFFVLLSVATQKRGISAIRRAFGKWLAAGEKQSNSNVGGCRHELRSNFLANRFYAAADVQCATLDAWKRFADGVECIVGRDKKRAFSATRRTIVMKIFSLSHEFNCPITIGTADKSQCIHGIVTI